jgi:hypothetical protein
MKAAILAVVLGLLLLVPIATVYAAGTITFSSPAPGSSFKGTQSYTISGTVSPAPGQPDNVFITVKNPNGKTVDAASVPVNPSTGAFTYNTATGGSADWVSGTYTITATDSFGATGSLTFEYTAAAAPTAGAAQLVVQVGATSPVYAGQQVQVMALVSWTNGTLAQSFVKVTAHYHNPSGTPTPLGAGMLMARGMYMWTISLPSNAPDGLYFVMVNANATTTAAWGAAGFTVNSQIASQSGLSSLQSSVNSLGTNVTKGFASLQSAVTSLSQTLSSLSTTVSQLQSSASNLATTLGNIQNQLTSLSNTASSLSSQLGTISSKVDNAASQASNAASAVGTTQVYVLIVAALAAITLVLELAILVRKRP